MANAGRFGASTLIDRPIEQVFDFLAAGVNDPKFSPRVQEIHQSTDGPVGEGTVFASTVKDAGFKSKREVEYTTFVRPSKLRWTERSKNMITVPEGGYDLEAIGENQTRLTFFNEFAASGFGKILVK